MRSKPTDPVKIKVGQIWRPRRGIFSAEVISVKARTVTLRKFTDTQERVVTVKVETLLGDYDLER